MVTKFRIWESKENHLMELLYEAVKCFLTKESAEQYNDSKKPISSANLAYLRVFWGKPVIIEPHRNYWIEFK